VNYGVLLPSVNALFPHWSGHWSGYLSFAADFRAALGLAITPPYETYILYEVYITPGLIGMIQLFNGMQSSLSMVYDREWAVCGY